jgi:putative membrane protein
MDWLPPANTALILISGAFLALGYVCIRQRRVRAHHRCMLTATVFAGLFLVVYVARWALLPTRHFGGTGAAAALYFAILVPHIVLAIAVGPLALIAIRRAVDGRFAAHKRIARVALPIWAFVAVTGWVIYVMLYLIDWGPAPAG